MFVVAQFCRKLATEMLAVAFDHVFPGEIFAIGRCPFIQPDFSAGEDCAFSVGGASIAVDNDVSPIFFWYVDDTRKTRVQEQGQFSWRGRAVDFRQKKTNSVAIYYEPPGCIPRRRGRWDCKNQQNGSANTRTDSSELGNAPAVSIAASQPCSSNLPMAHRFPGQG